MERTSFAGMWCSVAQCLDVVGDSWTMLIIREAFAGRTRFDELRAKLGIPRNTLRQRLFKLIDDGIIERVCYVQHPPRYEYRLTDAGQDLWPVLCALRQWGDHHGLDGRPHVRLVHRSCKAPIVTTPTCLECGQPVGPDDVELHDLAGTRWDKPEWR